MALDPEDVQALDARTEAACRAAVAGSLRMQAMTLRSQADLSMSMARTLDAQADAIDDGSAPVPIRPVALAVVPLEPEAPAEPEPEPGLLQAIEAAEFGSAGIFVPVTWDEFTPEMAAFFDLFDDRLKMSPHFVTAVNEAERAGRRIEHETAELIAARVAELRDAAARSETQKGGGDGDD
jgi:hypothetical protein